ncbi:MAG TPA: hypothetical protein VHP37_06905 [Burkholderiales bacterium]|nr:hypothetical protein [Burkholderiales bacterium]
MKRLESLTQCSEPGCTRFSLYAKCFLHRRAPDVRTISRGELARRAREDAERRDPLFNAEEQS